MHPRLAKAAMAALALLPLRLNHALGALLGELAWWTRSRLRRISEINLALCRPDLDDDVRRRIARLSLRETGKALTESAWLWHRPRSFVRAHVQASLDDSLLQRAHDTSGGLLVATPHMGSWELCNLPLTQDDAPITYLYRSPRTSRIEPALIEWRRNLNGEPARLDAGGIRQVIGELRAGRTVGMLPDQEPDAANGVFAPFFGTPALTMTLVARLASRSGATLFMFTERLPAGRGWRVHYVEPEPDIGDRDKHIAAAALNRTMERCIAINPCQYNWSYRRFRRLPDGGRRPYR